jgi:uncharacterized membrane protein
VRRACFFAGIAALIVAYELVWIHSDNIIVRYLTVWLMPFVLLFRLWPVAIIILLWLILRELRKRPVD